MLLLININMLSKIRHKVSEGGKRIKDKVGSGPAAAVLKLAGVALLLAVFFVLGNLFGDKIAMPLVSKIVKIKWSTSKPAAIRSGQSAQDSGPSDVSGGIVPPSQNATEEDKIKFSEAIRNAGSEVDTVKISESCAFDPFVARVKQGKQLKFKNDGSKETTVAIHKDLLTIPPKGSKTLDTNSVNMGIYGLVCGQNVGVGYLEITP